MSTITKKFITPFMAVMAVVLFCFAAPDAHAQKPQKFRGEVVAVDLEAQTITLETKRGGPVALKYDDATRFKSGIRKASDVQVGMVLRATQGEGEPAVHTFRVVTEE